MANNDNNATGTTTTTTTAVTEAAAPPPNEEEEEVPFLIRHDTEVTTATALTATTTIATSSRPPTKVTLTYFIGAVANLCSATLGAGILALPFAMKEAGIVFGLLLLLASGWGTFYSITILVKACDYYKLKTYESIVEKSLGKAWRQIVEISILIFCGGTAIAYVIAVGDILERVQSTHLPLLERKKLAMTVVWFISMLPLSCLKRMQSLQCASSVGIASILTLILAATVHLIRPQDQDPQDDDWTSPSFTDLKPFLWPTASTKGSSSNSWLLAVLRACPIVFFAFSCQVNVCQIYEELPSSSSSSSSGTDNGGDGRNNANNNVDDVEEEGVNNNTNSSNNNNKTRSMKWVTFTAVMICATLYLSISIVTIMDFGMYIKPNILSCYKLTSQETLLHVAFVAMAMAVVMAFPLNIFPARVSLIQMIHNTRKKPSAVHEEGDGFFYKSEAEQPLLGKNGDDGGNNNNNRNYGDLEHCGGGGGVDPLQSPHPTIQAPVQQQLSTLSVEDDDDEIDDNESDSFNIFEHMLVTLLLSGSALGLALVIPNISVVFGLLGGTTSSLLGFVIPGLLGMQMSKSSSNESNFDLGSWILVIAGTLIGILTTGVTIYSTFL